MKQLLLLILVVQIAFQPAFAKSGSVLMRSLESTDFELNQFLEIYKDHQSYAQYQLDLRQNSNERKELLRRFETAQKDFLSSSFSRARDSFSKVIELVRQNTWLIRDREMIFSSFVRMAQLNPQKSDYWLEEAAKFALDLSPDEKNFPPPLVQQAGIVRARVMNQIELWQPSFWESAAFIIVDGRLYKSDQKPTIPLTSGLHRVEVISNLSPSDTRVLTQKQILEYTFVPKVLTQGSCETPAIESNPLVNPSKLAVFYSITCVKMSTDKGWADLFSPSKYNLSPVVEYKTTNVALPEIKESTSTNKWWFVLLAGVAATGLYMMNENNKNRTETIQATHETGL